MLGTLQINGLISPPQTSGSHASCRWTLTQFGHNQGLSNLSLGLGCSRSGARRPWGACRGDLAPKGSQTQRSLQAGMGRASTCQGPGFSDTVGNEWTRQPQNQSRSRCRWWTGGVSVGTGSISTVTATGHGARGHSGPSASKNVINLTSGTVPGCPQLSRGQALGKPPQHSSFCGELVSGHKRRGGQDPRDEGQSTAGCRSNKEWQQAGPGRLPAGVTAPS